MSGGDRAVEFEQFVSAVAGLDRCDDVVSAWRADNVDRVAEFVTHFESGVHVLDCVVDEDFRSLTLLTELGAAAILGFDSLSSITLFVGLVESGNAEVLSASVSPDGRFLLALTDGMLSVWHEFDPLSVSVLGFFD